MKPQHDKMSPFAATPNTHTAPASKVRHLVDTCLPRIHAPTAPSWRYLPHLLLLAFILRAALALSGEFIIHPDEITQYLEPAHGLVFGNSILHWEYYFGARSWLVPGFIAIILFLCKIAGLGEPMYYLPAVKLTLCAFSLLIPLCMYHLGRRLFSEATARTALLLGVFWYELVGFAHKPMTEFIATALFLVLLTMVLRPRLTPAQTATASAFAVLVVAVRLQYAPLVALVWLIPFVRGCARTRLLMFAATAAAVCAVGLFDKLTWGEFLQPYRINYYFNVAFDKYRAPYEDTAGMYLIWLSIASGGLVLAALAGVFANRQRVFLLLLMLAVLLSHEMQAHREYRFLFILVPLWLLLCADVLCTGWRSKHTGGGRWRRLLLLGWAGLASAAGIANALPGQPGLYVFDYISPNRFKHLGQFLRNQDELLHLYLRLAKDPSVRGVANTGWHYHAIGNYTYLHRKVPLYNHGFFGTTGTDMGNYASHIIAPPLATIKNVEWGLDGKPLLFTKDGRVFAPPVYVSDAVLNKLVYWDNNGGASAVEGVVLAEATSQFTLWKTEPPRPVHKWKSYRIYLANYSDHKVLEESMGTPIKPPVKIDTFEFVSEINL